MQKEWKPNGLSTNQKPPNPRSFDVSHSLTSQGVEHATICCVVTQNRLPIGWTVRGSNSVGGGIFCTRPDWPWAPSSFYTTRTGSLPGVKRPKRGVHHPPHPAPRLRKKYIYTSTLAGYRVNFIFPFHLYQTVNSLRMLNMGGLI